MCVTKDVASNTSAVDDSNVKLLGSYMYSEYIFRVSKNDRFSNCPIFFLKSESDLCSFGPKTSVNCAIN